MRYRRLIIGSRSSKLAMAQAQYIMDRLKKSYPALDFEIKTIKTLGDKISDVALSKIGDKGIFTKEIEGALLRREVDLAVHSMKDLPTQLPQGLKIAAIAEREDPCDVLISKQRFTLRTLPKNSKIGTSSLRRRAQLLHIRGDLNVLDLRGNLDTRIRKLNQGLYDAIILAHAGIRRLGSLPEVEISSANLHPRAKARGFPCLHSRQGRGLKFSLIPLEDMLPQAGQGALGIEIHKDASKIDDLVKALDDNNCHLAVNAERALLAGLEGGCQVPIGVYARLNCNTICIKAGVFSLDGKRAIRDEIKGSKEDAEGLGRRLAERILKKKAAKRILDEIR